MKLVALLPWLAAIGLLLATLYFTVNTRPPRRHGWLFPALLSALFLAWSIATIMAEGLFGFWANHTSNLWGNQVWFDLLLAVGIGWYLIIPEAKSRGMRVAFWLFLIVCTGSIGFLAMLARLQYLRASRPLNN